MCVCVCICGTIVQLNAAVQTAFMVRWVGVRVAMQNIIGWTGRFPKELFFFFSENNTHNEIEITV